MGKRMEEEMWGRVESEEIDFFFNDTATTEIYTLSLHDALPISAALNGKLNNVGFRTHSIFGTQIPMTCPDVPSEILSPRETWKNDKAFYAKANELARAFNANFEKYQDFANDEIMSGSPKENHHYDKQ